MQHRESRSGDLQQISADAFVSERATVSGSGKLVIGPFCVIEDDVLLDTGSGCDSYIRLAPRTKLKKGAVLRTYNGHISVGARTTIGEYSILAGHGGITVGEAVIVAGHCYITAQEHILSSGSHIRFQGETCQGIFLEDGVWLGARVTVLDGVHIGTGTAIGAGAVVTRSLPPMSICAGIPCRALRKRT